MPYEEHRIPRCLCRSEIWRSFLIDCHPANSILTDSICSLTCRKRHLKCDEKPICGPCTRANRECVYGRAKPAADDGRSSDMVHQDRSALQAASPRRRSNSNAVPPGTDTRSPSLQQWSDPTFAGDMCSPQSVLSSSTAFGVEVAPLRWYSLLAGDAATGTHTQGDLLNSTLAAERQPQDSTTTQISTILLHSQSVSPGSANESIDERWRWQAAQPIQLTGHEIEYFRQFVKGTSLWLDLFDPKQYFSTFVPHLAMQNGSCNPFAY